MWRWLFVLVMLMGCTDGDYCQAQPGERVLFISADRLTIVEGRATEVSFTMPVLLSAGRWQVRSKERHCIIRTMVID